VGCPRICRTQPRIGTTCGRRTSDFIADATVLGGSLPILTILDEYARECHVLQMDRALAT